MIGKALLTAAPFAILATMIVSTVSAEGAYIDPYTMANRTAADTATRRGDVSPATTVRTDERYNTGGLFSGPRGWVYWNYLANPKGYQNPNLWPDKRPTYMFGEMKLPAGAELTVHGWFPHVRFFNFSIYLFERNTFVNADGGSIDGYDMEPDEGSVNPYRVEADRDATNRNFTLRILTKDAPTNSAGHAANTVYLGGKEQTIYGGFRMYVSDQGYDATGWGPGGEPSHEKPGLTYTLTLADGTRFAGEEVTKHIGVTMSDSPPPIEPDAWYKLVNNPSNNPAMTPASAPAYKDAQFFLFTGVKDAVFGAFLPPAERANIPPPKSIGGGANKSTAYLVNYISRQFGPVYVFRAKMPTFPDTWANVKTMPDGEVQYWSVATMATFVSGALWDGVFDMQVPLDKEGYYTIVVSRPEDRPKNATVENGIAWIDWGPGEGIDDPRNRKDWGALLMRFMVPHEDWENNPFKAKNQDELATVMGPYYPQGYYTTKEEFEAEGVNRK